MQMQNNLNEQPLKTMWHKFREANPNTRIRDAANELGTSEASLVATNCGNTATRLSNDWKTMLPQIKALGEVMALTRNDHAVHERHGIYDNLKVMGNMGIALNDDIDLRLFMSNWHYAFAVTEETRKGERHSLQFFDCDGTAIHKIYLTEKSNLLAYEKIIKTFKHADQSTQQKILEKPAKKPHQPDNEIDIDSLCVHWDNLQDTHDFVGLLKQFNVDREQSLRLAGDERAYKVSNKSINTLLKNAASLQLPIMIFVGNAGVIQIHTGTVNKIFSTGTWLNVLDPNFNLHLREDAIVSSWVVKKPSRDGQVSSLELFDEQHNLILQMFGKRKPGEQENMLWRDTLLALPTLKKTD